MSVPEAASTFLPSTTRVGMPAIRLPTGDGRARLLRLAGRGSQVCHKHIAPRLAQICDALVLALRELTEAEQHNVTLEQRNADLRQQLAEAEARNEMLLTELRRESFDEATATRTAPDLAAHERRTSVVAAQEPLDLAATIRIIKPGRRQQDGAR